MDQMKQKKGILLLNLGGPKGQSEVRPFLYRLFKDPEIIRIPFSPLRKFVAWWISTTRANYSKSIYRKIGGGSPIQKLTNEQSKRLEKALRLKRKKAFVRTAFSYSSPFVRESVRELAKKGIQDFLALPLYPQYSFTTTKTSFRQLQEALRELPRKTRLTKINSWPAHPLFIKAHAELIRRELKKFSGTKNVLLLFSAHSIPKNLVDKEGDPYKKQVTQTVTGVLKKLRWKGPWKLAWQSRLGPVKWLEPNTSATLQAEAKNGIKKVLIVPIAFVTDHIETLYEIDQLFKKEAKEAGIKEFRRTPGLNSHPTFIKALTSLALSKREFWSP